MNRLSVVGVVIVLAIMLTGCVDSRNTVDTGVVGEVEEVRITVAQKTQGSHNAVGGAIVGGLLAGTEGAVIGAAVGSGNEKVVVVSKLLGCKLIVRVDNQVIAYTFGEYGDLNECSLQKEGDKVNIRKIVWPDGTISYLWNGNFGEVLPQSAKRAILIEPGKMWPR
ncbi:MAG: hypothetical protein HYW77_00450 [Parcubacteria group bacterium]|nr:hypothetical protein [Parcubacteria group bacterium]